MAGLQALGDYTRVVSDFSKLPSQVKEGQVGSYWYHEDTQTFFDDAEHYKMIRAMCRLSCNICDKASAEEQPQQDGGYRKRQRFRNIGQLKAHLSHQHRLFMCDLCLEGRKVVYTISFLSKSMIISIITLLLSLYVSQDDGMLMLLITYCISHSIS